MTESRHIETIRFRGAARHGDQFAADSLEARNIEAALEASRMTWQAEFKPLYLENSESLGGMEPVDSHRALVRTDTGALLGVHKGQYSPVQIRDGFRGVQDLLDAGEARITRCGTVQGGRKVFVEATLERATGEVRVGDTIRTKLQFRNSFDGSTPVSVCYVLERLVCLNGMTRSEESSLFRGRHTASVHRELSQWRAEFDAKRAGLAKRVATWQTFARRRINEPALRAYIREVLSPGAGTDEEITVKGVDRIMEINETAPGAEPGTLWGAVNAVTYWATHERGRSDDARLTANMFGPGGALIERATAVATIVAPDLPMLELARQSYQNTATAKAEFDALLGRPYRLSDTPTDLA